MRCEEFSFASMRIDGVTYKHDAVIDRGEPAETNATLHITC